VKSTTEVKSGAENPPTFDAIVEDLADLKRDFVALMDDMKTNALNGVGEAAQSAIGRIGDGVANAYEGLAAQGRRSGRAIGRRVEEQPVASLLLAVAVRFCASRLLSR
jgi:hypothetical protein